MFQRAPLLGYIGNKGKKREEHPLDQMRCQGNEDFQCLKSEGSSDHLLMTTLYSVYRALHVRNLTPLRGVPEGACSTPH